MLKTKIKKEKAIKKLNTNKKIMKMKERWN
jgi:hypothetical protein